jgi:hypothetical protein
VKKQKIKKLLQKFKERRCPVMAQEKNLNQLVNVSEKTERERMVIAKEVVIKSLLPAVFQNVEKEKREEVFDRWYQKLLALVSGKDEGGSPYATREELEGVAQEIMRKVSGKKKTEPQGKVQPLNKGQKVSSAYSITEKQMKKIWAVAHNLGLEKEELEEKAGKRLSELTKKEASRLIDKLLLEEDAAVLYG